MHQLSEIITLIVSLILVVYLITLINIRKEKKSHYIWFFAIILIVGSQIATVIEGFLLPKAMNLIEHLFFFLACIMLLISILKKQLQP